MIVLTIISIAVSSMAIECYNTSHENYKRKCYEKKNIFQSKY